MIKEFTRALQKGIEAKYRKKYLLILGVIVLLAAGLWFWGTQETRRDLKQDRLWQETNFPVWDEMYAKGQYEELTELLGQAIAEDLPFFEWEHAAFCEVLEDLFHVDRILDMEAEEGSLPTYYYEDLLYYGWKMQGSYLADRLSEEELRLLEPYTERLKADFAARWHFTEEEREAFEKEQKENSGYVSYESCSQYIKTRMQDIKNTK